MVSKELYTLELRMDLVDAKNEIKEKMNIIEELTKKPEALELQI